MLVIDGSARLADTTERLVAALEAIPPGIKVGAIVASEPMRSVDLAPWSDAQKRAVVKLLRSTSFVGGQDNAPALAEALAMLEAEPNATLLWIHGPQPVSFRGSAARLEQAGARLSRLPDLVLYSVEPGPNELLPDAPWAWAARSLPQTGAPASRSRRLLPALLGQGADARDPPHAGASRRRARQGLRSHRPAVGERPRARADAGQSGRQPRSRGGARDPIPAGDAGQRRRGARKQAAIRREPPHAREPGDGADGSRAARMGLGADRMRGTACGSPGAIGSGSRRPRDASASASRHWSWRRRGTPGAGIAGGCGRRPRRRWRSC